MCPYFVLGPQMANETGDFGQDVIEACTEACRQDGSAALLNIGTDGVEQKSNKKIVIDYLNGKSNVLAIMDTNHNAKNNRYQILGGSSAASIGNYVFDPNLLVQAGVATELYRINDYASDAIVLRLASHPTLQKLNQLSTPYRWNVSVVAISLMMIRCRLYAVNSRDTEWKVRAALSYMSTLWFTSFHNHRAVGSTTLTMLPNKRNMLLETIANLFLFSRSDVSDSRRTTSEPAEHMFGTFRSIKQNVNVNDLIGIQNKANIRTEAIFKSNLVTSRSLCTNSGYQQTYPEFISAMKAVSTQSGPIDVDLKRPAVTQLFGPVQRVMNQVNNLMIPFLAKFGVDENNGMSPLLSATINSPADMISLIEDYFRPPKRDSRDFPPPADKTVGVDVFGANMMDDDENVDVDEDDVPIDSATATMNNVMNLVSNFIEETRDNSSAIDVTEPAVSTEPNEVVVDARDDRGAIADDIVQPMQKFFDVGDCGNEIMAEVKKMLSGGDVSTINAHNMKIMELLELGRLEGDKGSTIFDYKCKSFQQRWFEVFNKNREQEMEVDGEGEDIFVQCESLVVLRCQRGKSISYENYRVLASFSKHYKKWYPTGVQKHKWSKGNKDKDVRFLVSMMVQSGMSWKDYELENDSQFRPSCVFRVCSMDEIENVLGKLDEDLF